MTVTRLPDVMLRMDGGSAARILVVDDDPAANDLVTTVLLDEGFTVTSAGDAMGAFTSVRDNCPDLIVLDLMLPGIDGLEACREIRQRVGRSVAILMVSARGRASVVECLGAGADDYLGKPFDPNELAARVRALLRARILEHAAIRRAERLYSLQRLSAALVARIDEDEILGLVLDEGRRLLEASATVLYLWDARAGLLRPSRTSPRNLTPPPLVRRPGEGLIGKAFEANAPLFVNNYDRWQEATRDSSDAGVRAAAAAALVFRDERLGVVVASRTTVGESVDEEDAQLLGLLASHAAVAVANARAYAEQRESGLRAARRAAELEAVLESMSDGVLLVDESGIITSANRASVSILGVTPDGLFERPISDLLVKLGVTGAGSNGTVSERWLRELCTQADETELVLQMDDGQQRVLAVVAQAIGGGQGTLVVIRDVTLRRQSQERVAQAEKLQALGQMASGVAHDVNNLLAAILGRSELARLEVEREQIDQPRLLGALTQIEQAAEDGARTVRRIQEFARDRRGNNVVTLDFGRVVAETVELTRPTWSQPHPDGQPIDVQLDLEPGLLVTAEATELREVLTNLILNGVDAMPRGGQLWLVGRRQGDSVRLDVTDTGVGMSREVTRRVFEPFFTTKVEGGTGLGLAVAYNIIRRRGGQLTVTSVPDGGSTFTIELPFAGPSTAQPQERSARPGPTDRLHVLVVDDEPSLASIVRRLLTFEGYEVTVCAGGEEALKVFDPEQHHLVLTDYGMPGMTGSQLAAQINRISPATPVILVTGWGSDPDSEAPPIGVTAVVAKPYRLATLVQTVKNALADADGEATAGAQNGSPPPAP